MSQTRKTTRSRKLMNEENYNLIKLMYAKMGSKASLKNMSDITGYGKATISRVKATSSYPDYVKFQQSYKVRKSPKTALPTKPSLVEVKPQQAKASHPASTEALVRIAVAVERIATALERKQEIEAMADDYIAEQLKPEEQQRTFWSKR